MTTVKLLRLKSLLFFSAMHHFNLIFFLLILSCSDQNQNSDSTNSDEIITTNSTQTSEPKNELSYFDSLKTALVDTTTLSGKREFIMNQFLIINEPQGPDFDTLFDLNYDQFEDYVIGFTYQSGTGIKNGIEVYLYNKTANSYLHDSLLSDLANPSFYLDDKIITGFYLGHGGGDGVQLEWIKNEWVATKRFSVSYQDDKESIWHITFPLTGKKTEILRQYEDVPPEEILRNEYN